MLKKYRVGIVLGVLLILFSALTVTAIHSAKSPLDFGSERGQVAAGAELI